MINNRYFSNVYIDIFVEKISNLGVKAEDIDNYLNMSTQYELLEDTHERMNLIDNLFTDFQSKYPNIYEIVQDDITQVYMDNRVDF